MKKLFLVVLLCLFLVSPAMAVDTLVLTWDENPASENVDLYRVNIDSGAVVVDVVPNTYELVTLPDGPHTAMVAAHNAWGWSAYSLPFDFTKGVPGTPVNLRLEVKDLP